jgi:hypothetical protein
MGLVVEETGVLWRENAFRFVCVRVWEGYGIPQRLLGEVEFDVGDAVGSRFRGGIALYSRHAL